MIGLYLTYLPDTEPPVPEELLSLYRREKLSRQTNGLVRRQSLLSELLLRHALRESGWLVALCSEEYIASRWCMREISDFIAMGKKDRILPILVSGTKETAVPAEIQDLPIAADLRNAGENGSFRSVFSAK